MDKIVFTEEFCQPENLHPFTLTRQMQDIRVGILTIREKWERMLGLPSFDKKEDDYKDLDRSVHIDEIVGDGSCFIVHGNILPTPAIIKLVRKLKPGDFVATAAGNGIVYRVTRKEIIDRHKIRVGKPIIIKDTPLAIQFPWDIFRLNAEAIKADFRLLTAKRKSASIPKSNRVVKSGNIFIEKGARVEFSIINAGTGPVYIGKNAEVMEGCIIRGPFAMGEGSCLKMGTKVYGATTLGPGCVAGGEIKNSVMFGYSNKAHDGYLGDSVIGEWCNLGAGTTNSNLKNNAGQVRVWTPSGQMDAGKKCGVMMGDYARTTINTSINTGTVVGACAHVSGSGLTPKYIPPFAWGSDGVMRYEFEKAVVDISEWKKLKGKSVENWERSILKYVYDRY